jgi:nucleoid-associated protein YgaU
MRSHHFAGPLARPAHPPHERRSMRILLLAIPFLAVAMYATNPGAKTHRVTITDDVYGTMPRVPGGTKVTRATIDRAIGQRFSYGDYGVFSVGRVAGKAATVGVVGQVVPADPKLW